MVWPTIVFPLYDNTEMFGSLCQGLALDDAKAWLAHPNSLEIYGQYGHIRPQCSRFEPQNLPSSVVIEDMEDEDEETGDLEAMAIWRLWGGLETMADEDEGMESDSS